MAKKNAVAQVAAQGETLITEMIEDGRISPDQAKDLRSALSKAPKRMTEEELLRKRPHLIAGTLNFDALAKKQGGLIHCTFKDPETGERCEDKSRRVHTSDLHQVTMCVAHKDQQGKAKKDAKKQLLVDFAAAQKAKAETEVAQEVEA